MDWQECIKNRTIKRVSRDSELIKSLMITSRNKETSASYLEINDITYASVITLYYDALRELLEALALREGYKIYNHECYVYFLKDVLKKEDISNAFNRIRKIRNSINYYGEELSIKEAEATISDIKKLILEFKSGL